MPLKIRHQEGDYTGPRARLYILDERIRRGDYPSHKSLAKHCGVSTKTIQRDLAYMQYNMDCPLEYDEHRKGWHYTAEEFFLPLSFASREDFQAILIIGELVGQYAGTPLGGTMHKAFEKVLVVFKGKDVGRVRSFVRRISFAGAPNIPVDWKVWEAIFVALQKDQTLELEYRKGGRSSATTTRRFDPWGLIVRNRDWFLHGYCHLRKVELNLFVPSISKAALVDGEYFDVPKKFDLARYTRAGFMALQASGAEQAKVVLRFAPDVAEMIEKVPFAHDQTLAREPSGHVRVAFSTNALFQVEREVLHWGANVEVVEPPQLRARVKDVARKIVANYSRELAPAAGR
jgi:predicted DNA-binding transcriptional regulator YafY